MTTQSILDDLLLLSVVPVGNWNTADADAVVAFVHLSELQGKIYCLGWKAATPGLLRGSGGHLGSKEARD